jgi:hypothetical protein
MASMKDAQKIWMGQGDQFPPARDLLGSIRPVGTNQLDGGGLSRRPRQLGAEHGAMRRTPQPLKQGKLPIDGLALPEFLCNGSIHGFYSLGHCKTKKRKNANTAGQLPQTELRTGRMDRKKRNLAETGIAHGFCL